MKKRRVIATDGAPKAIGPYSQGIAAGGWLFTAGQIGLDPVTAVLVEGDTAAQARRALLNLQAVVEAAGGTLDDVVRVTVYVADLKDFAAVNEVMARFFPKEPPARSTVEVSRLPRDAKVEIDAQVWLGVA